MLGLLRNLLEEAGEFEWRSNAQRWVIFGETDYDRVFKTIFPDMDPFTSNYVGSLEILPGANVLEIGAGTGRTTVDLGLAAKVADMGGPWLLWSRLPLSPMLCERNASGKAWIT